MQTASGQVDSAWAESQMLRPASFEFWALGGGLRADSLSLQLSAPLLFNRRGFSQ